MHSQMGGLSPCFTHIISFLGFSAQLRVAHVFMEDHHSEEKVPVVSRLLRGVPNEVRRKAFPNRRKWALKMGYLRLYIHSAWWVLTCFKHHEKYMKVNGKDDIPYMKWKMKNVPNHQPAFNGDNM